MSVTEITAHLKHKNTSGVTTVIYPVTKATNIEGTLSIGSGGTGANTAANARANLGIAPAFTYGTSDIVAGSASSEADGTIHFVYTTENDVWDHVKSIFITVEGIWRLIWNESSSNQE